jgi:kynurenine formamidase
MDLEDVLLYLRACEWIDLTHAFEPGIPHYAPFPDEERRVVFGFKPNGGTLGSGFLVHEYRHVGQWGTHVDPPAHFIEGGRTLDALPVEEMVLPLVVLDVREQVSSDSGFAATDATIGEHEAEYGQIPDRAFVALLTGWRARWPDVAAMENRDAQGISRAPATWPKPMAGSGFPARCFAITPRAPSEALPRFPNGSRAIAPRAATQRTSGPRGALDATRRHPGAGKGAICRERRCSSMVLSRTVAAGWLSREPDDTRESE